jgi:hypothetical protein
VAAVAVILSLAGGAFAGPREPREKGRDREREQGVITVVKRMLRALGDGLTVPLPKPNP